MSLDIDCEFPGGNIIVERVEGDDVYLRQDHRDTEGFWFYWYFRVTGAEDRNLTFHFTGGDVIGLRGPGLSTDGGESWSWLGRDSVDQDNFSYTFSSDVPDVRFSVAMPYTQKQLDSFLGQYKENSCLTKQILCTSRKGREVEQLFLKKPDTDPQYRLFFTCRHHCCEMMASYVIEGIMEEILSGSQTGKWLLENTEVCIVPFADKDGVEEGDQGKKRLPRDHGRDYEGKNLYPETAAVQNFLPAWARSTPAITFDIHCPGLKGNYNEYIYFVGGRDAENWQKVSGFAALLESENRGALPYAVKNNLPFGEAWNKPGNSTRGRGCKRWAQTLPGIEWAAAIEIPYASAGGQEVNVSSARAFGRNLVNALKVYLSV